MRAEQYRHSLVALGFAIYPPAVEMNVSMYWEQVKPLGGSSWTSSVDAQVISDRPTAKGDV